MLKIMDLASGVPDRSALATISEKLSNEFQRTIVRQGDLVLSVVGTIGSVLVVPESLDGVNLSRALARLLPGEDLVPQWLVWVFSSENFTRFVDMICVGSAQRVLNMDDLRSFRAPFPPVDEQTVIATFLDHETAKIDALVSEQERLIELLKEKRQAVISHAVTKGLAPSVPMKDSGVEWLGEVPAHWSLSSLARISTDRCDGPFGSGIKSEHYTENGALVVRLQNIRAEGYHRGEPVFLDMSYFLAELRGHEVVAGDLLVAGLGDENNLLGRACVAPEDLGTALVKADCFRFRLGKEIAVPEFVALQLNAGAAYDAGVLATGTTRSRIPLGIMATRIVALPPSKEQLEISLFLTKETLEIDSLKAEAESVIDLLKERKSALISAAVTGQIDVRGWVPAETAA
ncbi:restriction endonuclease subunit S [Hydrogenophaga atypica]|uniref:Restriction endonuclease subunit S n=1 Tax=Hydrogenophaga atypica TaxID=249409 RepID=A0ABW2QRY5_9BURK